MTAQPVKIAVLVSGGGTNLQALLKAQQEGQLKSGQIALVLSDKKDAPALLKARNAGILSLGFDKKEMGLQSMEAAFLRELERHEIQVIVLAGFLTILSPDFISAYENRILNVHPSLIPAFCGPGFYGLKVHEAALERGVKLTGATVHLVNEEADGGPIIKQKAVPVLDNDTPQTLQRRVMEEAEWLILPEAVEEVCANLRGRKDKL